MRRVQTGSHHTLDTTNAGLRLFRPMVLRWREGLRWCPGNSRRCFTPLWFPIALKSLKPLGVLSGDHRFNAVYSGSKRCFPAYLHCGFGWPVSSLGRTGKCELGFNKKWLNKSATVKGIDIQETELLDSKRKRGGRQNTIEKWQGQITFCVRVILLWCP